MLAAAQKTAVWRFVHLFQALPRSLRLKRLVVKLVTLKVVQQGILGLLRQSSFLDLQRELSVGSWRRVVDICLPGRSGPIVAGPLVAVIRMAVPSSRITRGCSVKRTRIACVCPLPRCNEWHDNRDWCRTGLWQKMIDRKQRQNRVC